MPSQNMRWPLKENRIRKGLINHTFGLVRNNGTKPHQGWDFYAIPGTECFAVASGKVVRVDQVAANGNPDSFGKLIVIKLDSITIDGQTVYAAYAHLSEISPGISLGNNVTLGQLIGKTGNTGNASNMTGADQHLHFELRKEVSPSGGTGLTRRFDPKRLYGDPPLQSPVIDCTPTTC